LASETTARSQYNGASAAIHAGGRYTFFFQQDIELIPFGSMDWIYISQEGFNESNADSFNLNVKKNGESFLRSEWGVAVSRPFCYSWGTFVPKANVSWLFLTPISGDGITANFEGIADPFTVNTTNRWVNQFAAGLELLLWMNNDLSFGGIYKGIFGSQISEQEVRATAVWKF
jgi:outer membrane autotransporter protein